MPQGADIQDRILLIFDNGSRNGTFVNETRVTENGFALQPGDVIRVGMSAFQQAAPGGDPIAVS
jgi:pSer/pThr/pTyr-binding forkhead associated (FHA) protein